MKFDLSKPFDKNKANSKLEALIEKGGKCEITEIRKKRTHSQNKYIHVLFGLFGVEFGFTLDESKTHLKRGCAFMVYEKGNYRFLKSTGGLNTKELTDFIDWIREYSGDQGCYLPTPDEYREEFIYFDNEINKSKKYL